MSHGDIKTTLLKGNLGDWHALRRDSDRLRAAHRHFNPDLFPEERAAEERLVIDALAQTDAYGALTARESRKLDRFVAQLLPHALPLVRLATPHHAYRYDWVHGYLEAHEFPPGLRASWYMLSHGRRFGSGTPENVPYYAWLPADACRSLSLELPAVLERMELDRQEGGITVLLRRRGAANDAAYWLMKELVPLLEAVARDGDARDLFAITG